MKSANRSKHTKYWASAPKENIAAEIADRFSAYQHWLASSGYFDRIQASYNMYYGHSQPGSFGVEQDADGVLSSISVPHYKNLLQRLHNLCTQAKLAYQPRARNSDSKSQIQSDFAKGLLEYYSDEKDLNRLLSSGVETALVCNEVFIWAPWDQTAGSEVRPDENNRVIFTGDQAFSLHTADAVARSTTVPHSPWHIIRTKANKWDLIAQNPDAESAVISAGTPSGENQELWSPYRDDQDDDSVYVDVLVHERTPAMPNGRMTRVIGDYVLEDGPLGYQEQPIVRLSAGDVIGSVSGDSPATSILSLQEGLDALYGAVLTNNLNGAVSNIYSSDPNTSIKQLSKGQNLIIGASAPAAVSLTGSSAETYKLIQDMIGQQQLLSGINETVRGNPGAAVSTAGGQALMLAQAIQFISALQANYARAAGDLASIIIKNLQSFASEPRLAYLGGISRRSYVKEFTNKDIMSIDRVSVDLGNPMAQTITGRYELAREWIQAGVVKDPMRISEFLRTGQVDSLTEDPFKDAILIRDENEQIRKGINPPVLITDNHIQHFLDHRELFSDPILRLDPVANEAGLAHMREHMAKYKSMDPDMAAILQLPPLPSMSLPPAPSQGQPSVEGEPLPQVPPGTPAQVADAYAQGIAGVPPEDAEQ